MVPIDSKKFRFPMPIRDRVIPPPFISEELYAKKGRKVKKSKKSKTSSKVSQQVSQKINIKIGDLSKFKKDDTALLHKQEKASQYPIFPTSSQTYLRLEAPYFKYATPLVSTVPNLYQSQPSSISQPIIPAQPVVVKAQDLQPQKITPIIQDTDPNDLQRNLRSHVSSGYSTPSPYYISGYSTPASRQEEYIADRLLTERPDMPFMIATRWLEQPKQKEGPAQASSSIQDIQDANNESLRLQRLQNELFNPQQNSQVVARKFFTDKQPIPQLQPQLQPSQAERIIPQKQDIKPIPISLRQDMKPIQPMRQEEVYIPSRQEMMPSQRSMSSREAGYIPDVRSVMKNLKKGSFSV